MSGSGSRPPGRNDGMKKIRRFRLNLNKQMFRRELAGRCGMGSAIERFDDVFAAVEQALDPAAIFVTVGRNECETRAAELWSDCCSGMKAAGAVPKHMLAASFAVVTLGAGLDSVLAASAGDPERCAAVEALAERIIDLAGDFIRRLICADAEAQQCVIEQRFTLPLERSCAALAPWLDPHKIDVARADDGAAFAPAFSRLYFFPWLKKRRAR